MELINPGSKRVREWRARRAASKRRQTPKERMRRRLSKITCKVLKKEAVVNVLTNGEGTCRWCGEGDIEVLCVDHVKNDGARHRRMIGPGTLYTWLIQHDYPAGFQILCYNCNVRKLRQYERECRMVNYNQGGL